MTEFEYYFNFSQKIICEVGFAKKVGILLKEEYNAKKIMIVTDYFLRSHGLISDIEDSLRNNSLDFVVFDEVKPNPDVDVVKNGEKLAKQCDIDYLIGIGGGSSIDTAKAIGIVLNNGGPITKYESIKYQNDPLPVIAIPTTAGTGSESTPATVITDHEAKKKIAISSGMKGLPKVAILDASLLQSLNSNLAATTGMDALSHAIESYTSLKANALTESISLKAINLIGKHLRMFVANRGNINSAQAMLIASNLAGISLSHTLCGNVHALSHPIGGYYNAPHGIINSVLLPYVMQFNLISNPNKFKKIAILLGENVSALPTLSAAKKSITAVKKISRDLGIPIYLDDIDVKKDHIDEICEIALQSRNAFVNPRKSELEDFICILNSAFRSK